MRVRIFYAALLALLFVGPSFAQALSKQDLLDLRKSGVADSVLIKQIEKDGISFEMNSATTIELKNLGLSDDVLSALLGSRKPTEKPSPVSQNESIAALYKAGKFPELADHLKATLKANPVDYKTHALLIMTLLKMKEKDAAQTEFSALAAHDQDPTAAPYVKQVKALLDTLAKTQQAKDKLLAALKEYRTPDAMAVVDELPASPTQKEILKVNLDVYQAKYDQARNRFAKLQFVNYSEKERAAKIVENIRDTESAYNKAMSRLNLYLYSEWADVICYFPITTNASYNHVPALASMSAQDYINAVGDLVRIAPLNEGALDLAFHAELLTGIYEETEHWGDGLLKAKGSIRIPFYASDRFFRVVIDSREQRIYTEPDEHIFRDHWRTPNTWWADLVSFNLSFGQITGLSQKAGGQKHTSNPSPEKKSYALKFEPAGLAPNYALMNILLCSVGEQAQLTATRNLGQYVLHVLNNNLIATAGLVDPGKVQGPSGGWLTGLLMAGASMSSNSALSSMAIQGLQANQAQEVASFQAQQVAWESFTAARETFNFVEADAFTGLEQLLGVLN
jgi:hypothetical protein